jgi:murein L,D-transpeptidase YcbB/YkuD
VRPWLSTYFKKLAVNAFGEVLFFEDIYGEDEELLRALDAGRRPAG